MANTTPLTYRIDTDIKNQAEEILLQLGMTPTVAIQTFYKQVIINQGLPFTVKLQTKTTPVALHSLSDNELNHELLKGYRSINNDRNYTPEEVDQILSKEFDI